MLEGTFADQAALHGVLATIDAFGLEMLEVRRPRAFHDANVGRPRPRRR